MALFGRPSENLPPGRQAWRRLWAHGWPQVAFLGRWVVLAAVVGTLAGSASALFLAALAGVTTWRETHPAALGLLPVAGLLIGLLYHYGGGEASKGYDLLLEQIHRPRQRLPLHMAPLVLLGTLATHLVGGSAGREGTAVQMGGALADQLTRWLPLRPRDRRLLLVMGLSAGFASVFGTPLAGAVFGLEVLVIGAVRYEALVPAFLAAAAGHYVTLAWGSHHPVYPTLVAPVLAPVPLLLTVACGIGFGLTARGFAALTHSLSRLFGRYLTWPPLRPAVGGLALLAVFAALGTTRYCGLGVPVILAAFAAAMPLHVAALKLVLTALTLGSGFKGGEVTPLFFIGATLGSALAVVVPLPVALLAGMGFVAVFAGAANTPLACTLLGLELFGAEAGVYLGLACVVAYLFSGHSGIYPAQRIGQAKHLRFGRDQGRTLAAPWPN